MSIVVGVAALSVPASAADAVIMTPVQNASADGPDVTVSIKVAASRPTVVTGLTVCAKDSTGRDFTFPRSEKDTVNSTGVTKTLTKSFSSGTYSYWACGNVDGTQRELSGVKHFNVSKPRGVPGRWRQVFHDDFRSRTLDRTKWSTGWFGDGVTGPIGRDEPACYDPANVELKGDGYLSLSMERRTQRCSNQNRPWTTGMVSTNGKFEFTYGAAQARFYLPAGSDGQPINWGAFWLNGQTWPNDGEIDIFESSNGSTGAYYHSSAGNFGAGIPGVWAGWHTATAVWEPGKVSYYWDGKLVHVVDKGVVKSPMYIILSFGPSADRSLSTAGKMRFSYVKVWQRA